MATTQEAKDRAERIRQGAADLAALAKEAWDERDWETLGYATWNEYVKTEFGGNAGMARRLVIESLAGQGISEREIAAQTGVSNATVHRDIKVTESSPGASSMKHLEDTESPHDTESARPSVQGRDGKVYPPRKPSTSTATKTRRAQVEKVIKNLTEANGKVPSGRDVARRLNLSDDRTVRKDWDALYALGRAPKRPEPSQKKGIQLTDKQLERSEVTQELLSIRERILRVSRVIDTTAPEYKDAAREHWIKLASSLSQGVEDLMGKLTGDMWDKLLDSSEESK